MAFINRRRSLFIRGAPDAFKTMTLYTGPSGDEGDSTDKPKIPLVMAGQPGGVIPLTIGPNGISASGAQPLYINGGYGVGGGGADWQGYGNLVTFGTTGINHTDTATLFVNSTTTEGMKADADLFISASPQPAASGVSPLFISSTQINASGDGSYNSVAPLYIRSNPAPNTNMTLKVKTDFDTNVTAPLYIANTVEDNNITTVIDGKGQPSGVMNLTMKAPDASNISLHIKSYLE
jgi:hypothetical protein